MFIFLFSCTLSLQSIVDKARLKQEAVSWRSMSTIRNAISQESLQVSPPSINLILSSADHISDCDVVLEVLHILVLSRLFAWPFKKSRHSKRRGSSLRQCVCNQFRHETGPNQPDVILLVSREPFLTQTAL